MFRAAPCGLITQLVVDRRVLSPILLLRLALTAWLLLLFRPIRAKMGAQEDSPNNHRISASGIGNSLVGTRLIAPPLPFVSCGLPSVLPDREVQNRVVAGKRCSDQLKINLI